MFDYRALYEIQLQVSVDFLRVVQLSELTGPWFKQITYLKIHRFWSDLSMFFISICEYGKTVTTRIYFSGTRDSVEPPGDTVEALGYQRSHQEIR